MKVIIPKYYKPKLKEGDKFNKLKAVKYIGHNKLNSSSIWLFECECGKLTEKEDIQVRRGHTKTCSRSCGCYKGKNIALINSLYKTYKIHAKNRNLNFKISNLDFENLILKNCEYCGTLPLNNIVNKRGDSLLYNGIDRLDNKIGYELNNCITCCKVCNFSKNNMTIEDFKNWINNIINFKSKLLFNEL